MTSATDPTATPTTVLTRDLENAALPEAKKQKQEGPAVEEAKPKKSFKAVANLVLAMKRFQCKLTTQILRHGPLLHSLECTHTLSTRLNHSFSRFIPTCLSFAAAINPTYEYGKQPNQQRLSRAVRQDSPVASGVPEVAPRSLSRNDHLSFDHRGHKAEILLSKLPDTAETLSDQE
jgi:hypothetical protein